MAEELWVSINHKVLGVLTAICYGLASVFFHLDVEKLPETRYGNTELFNNVSVKIRVTLSLWIRRPSIHPSIYVCVCKPVYLCIYRFVANALHVFACTCACVWHKCACNVSECACTWAYVCVCACKLCVRFCLRMVLVWVLCACAYCGHVVAHSPRFKQIAKSLPLFISKWRAGW